MYICHKKRHVNTYMQHLPTYPGNKWESESGWGAGAAADGFPSIIQTDRVSTPCGWCLYACVCDDCLHLDLMRHCWSGDVLLCCTSCDGVTYVYVCGLSRRLPSPCHFYNRYHDADENVNDWTEGLRQFNRGGVMPLSLMLLGFGLCFGFFCFCFFLKKSQSVY